MHSHSSDRLNRAHPIGAQRQHSPEFAPSGIIAEHTTLKSVRERS